jgi:hypothetical protein
LRKLSCVNIIESFFVIKKEASLEGFMQLMGAPLTKQAADRTEAGLLGPAEPGRVREEGSLFFFVIKRRRLVVHTRWEEALASGVITSASTEISPL